jgi:hypothetical protein
MDILTHALSGIAVGTVIVSFSDKKHKGKLGLIGLAGFGAVLPDLDAISLWSKFDSILGSFLGLKNSGQEIYFSKFWYSHHGFLHSLMAGVIIALLSFFLIFVLKRRLKMFLFQDLLQNLKNQKMYVFSFIAGFIIHLIEDMPTPSCVWGGVNFLWTSKIYVGGTGDIWWWNNYDIFLIVISVIGLNGIAHVTSKFIRIDIRKITAVVFFLGVALSLYQIKTRDFDFNYTGHTPKYQQFEIKSKEIQEKILGEKLYNLMLEFDNKIPVNF